MRHGGDVGKTASDCAGSEGSEGSSAPGAQEQDVERGGVEEVVRT